LAVKKTDRDAVIDAALDLFRLQGYHDTSMADVAKATGLLKGSIYHYFDGKEALALAALDRVIDETRDKIFAIADDATLTEAERMHTLCDAAGRYFTEREGGCVIGNLALELGDSIDSIGDRIRTYFDNWETALACLLTPRYGADKAAELARDAVARAQGAIMMMGIHKDPSVLHRAGLATRALLDPDAGGDERTAA